MNKPAQNMHRAEKAARHHLGLNSEVLRANGVNHRLYVMRTMLDLPTGSGRKLIVDHAKAGDRSARRACLEVAAKSIAEGHELRPPLASFISQILVDAAKAPKGKKGQDPKANRIRDLAIAAAVHAASDDGGIPATRNVASKGVSGSSVVAHILPEFGLHLSEHAVEKIWKRYKKLAAAP